MRKLTTFIVSLMGVLAAPVFAQVYIADSQDNEIRAVNTTTGIISTAAGNGTAGYSGDGGVAINAELHDPTGIAVDSSGNLYIADTQNNRVRKVVGGHITAVAGTGTPGSSGVPGLAINAQLNNPTGVAVDSTGNIYIADEYNNRILKVDTSGHITAVAGTGAPGYSGDGGLATSAQLYYPTGVAVDGGILYIADSKNNRIRAVGITGNITTYAGTGVPNFSGACPNGIATALPLNTPYGVAVDGSHNLYIADEADWCIRKVTTSGAMTTVAGGINSTTYNPPGDGSLATKVGLNYPTGVAVDGSGNLYIVDDDNNAVRKVVLSTGIITTFAGSGAPGCSPPGPGNGGQAVNAKLCDPTGVAVLSISMQVISACIPTSSLAVTVGTNVNAYVPNGSWDYPAPGIQEVPLEGTGVANTFVTPGNVNSCASNSVTGEVICTENGTNVDLINGSTLTTLTSGANAYATFSGGQCQNCGVGVNAANNTAVITMGLVGGSDSGYFGAGGGPSGVQVLNLGPTSSTVYSPATLSTFNTPFPLVNYVSEDISIDPTRNLVLSPGEGGVYDLLKIGAGSALTEFGNDIGSYDLDSAAEDCTTGIALSSSEFSDSIYITDLTQAVFTPGSPGTWTAPGQFVNLSDGGYAAGTSGISSAPGSGHLAVVTGEFGGSAYSALQLPSTSGAGTPTLADWAYVSSMPNTPDGAGFSAGFDPHTVTAYTSPNTSKAYAVFSDYGAGPTNPDWLGVVDLACVLALPRTPTTHDVTPAAVSGTGPGTVSSCTRYVAIP